MILDTINNPNDIKNIPEDQLPELADEIRSFLIRKISKTGGHLRRFFNLTMKFKRVFDMHQFFAGNADHVKAAGRPVIETVTRQIKQSYS